MDSLIDSMMLVEEGDEDEDEQKDLFRVHDIPNPAFQRHFQVLWYRRDGAYLHIYNIFWLFLFCLLTQTFLFPSVCIIGR